MGARPNLNTLTDYRMLEIERFSECEWWFVVDRGESN